MVSFLQHSAFANIGVKYVCRALLAAQNGLPVSTIYFALLKRKRELTFFVSS